MSSAVQRRRGTAAQMATFTGLVGEITPDTTNNRAVVHDGATAGGFPAATIGDLPGRNALLNGNFAINQRAYTTNTALAAGAYGHDRWKAGSAGCTYSFPQASPDTTILIKSGTLIQAVDTPNAYATVYWLTWTGTANARVWQGTASGAYANGTPFVTGSGTVNALLVSGLAVGTIVNVEFAIGSVGTVQLEAALPNAGPTRFERRHGELALCQRYFQNYGGTNASQPFATGVFYGSNSFSMFLPLRVVMRAAPTAVYAAAANFVIAFGSGNAAVTLFNFTNSSADALGFGGQVASNAGSAIGNVAIMQANNTTAATIQLSAEI